jgi:hypothetical protein
MKPTVDPCAFSRETTVNMNASGRPLRLPLDQQSSVLEDTEIMITVPLCSAAPRPRR